MHDSRTWLDKYPDLIAYWQEPAEFLSALSINDTRPIIRSELSDSIINRCREDIQTYQNRANWLARRFPTWFGDPVIHVQQELVFWYEISRQLKTLPTIMGTDPSHRVSLFTLGITLQQNRSYFKRHSLASNIHNDIKEIIRRINSGPVSLNDDLTAPSFWQRACSFISNPFARSRGAQIGTASLQDPLLPKDAPPMASSVRSGSTNVKTTTRARTTARQRQAAESKSAPAPLPKPAESKPTAANAGAGIPKNHETSEAMSFPNQIFHAFKILNLKETQCHINDITKAWRKLASRYHPDNKKFADPIKYQEVDKAYNFLRELYQPCHAPLPPPATEPIIVKPTTNTATPFKDMTVLTLALPYYSEEKIIATILAAYEILNIKQNESIECAFKRYITEHYVDPDSEWYKVIDTCRLLLTHAPSATIEDNTLRQWAMVIIEHAPKIVDKYEPRIHEIEAHTGPT